ncbi:hypothetical protein AMATHDRAFT_48961 [Amanita thiersii Skay4041]|uniref:FAD-binding domain-containing protein n=1 Tax=Amanita thiersii Skay4041 TaxID=703135 RepID=A0A2A9NLE4_9AGAR|nr:hypothetical protein AMATHDRAFT_48961 [Amanita thiersii Skay4041]
MPPTPLPARTTVLVVGAGPTGLAAAASLVQHGCRDVVVVDGGEIRAVTSRAMAIHAATSESLEKVGCMKALVDIGIQGKAIEMRTPLGKVFDVDFAGLAGETQYPYVLLVSQYSTERVLEERLEEMGVHVHRPYRLEALNDDEDDEDGGCLVAKFDSGDVIRANYVIGADGAKSTVRQLSHIGFEDPDKGTFETKAMAQVVFADITLSAPIPYLPADSVKALINPGAFLLTVPVPRSPYPESRDHTDKAIYRIGMNIPLSHGAPPPSPSADYLQKYINGHGPLEMCSDPSVNPNPVRIEEVLWSTRLRVHAAIAERFINRVHAKVQSQHKNGKRNARIVFLVGDAAHIHSPIGGQGMNLGLRDAIGIGEVVAKHIVSFPNDPEGADELIERYAANRYERAISTISLTKRAMAGISMIGVSGFVLRRVVFWVMKLVFNIPFVKRRLARRVSGLGNR